MSAASVVVPADEPEGSAPQSSQKPRDKPRYAAAAVDDPALIEAAQWLRYDAFSRESGFVLQNAEADYNACPYGMDTDRFDEYCDHLLVREENSGELVGRYRMLSPMGAAAAGGLYIRTARCWSTGATSTKSAPPRDR